jgi:hypothetical protein
MRRMRSPCCARATNGHAAAPPSSVMKARRFMPATPSGPVSIIQDDSTARRVLGRVAHCAAPALKTSGGHRLPRSHHVRGVMNRGRRRSENSNASGGQD